MVARMDRLACRPLRQTCNAAATGGASIRLHSAMRGSWLLRPAALMALAIVAGNVPDRHDVLKARSAPWATCCLSRLRLRRGCAAGR
ncbi:protein of unknown function (plasmid) [Methylocella tundrae]|uniref:Uncharacterized protein n=1 Tax=Methylocella tundrae TaxID=227605 RepID=A0A4U8Z6M2_METTU|nr:protein of unknown function [Methylocella tundrae]